eukprot:499511-Pelagomonas_calceolata.AAC.2
MRNQGVIKWNEVYISSKLAAIKVEEGKMQLHRCTWHLRIHASFKQPTQLKEHKQRFDIIIAE